MSRPWTAAEVQFLQLNKALGLEACASALGRSLAGVRNMSTKLFRKQYPLRWCGYGQDKEGLSALFEGMPQGP